jgi:hypothetical protein
LFKVNEMAKAFMNSSGYADWSNPEARTQSDLPAASAAHERPAQTCDNYREAS